MTCRSRVIESLITKIKPLLKVADWCGGKIAREAKAVARSAFVWSHGGSGETRDLYREILGKGPLPGSLHFREAAVDRAAARSGLHAHRAGRSEKEKQAERLLHATGWETANVHLGSATAAALLVDLSSRPDGWLGKAVEEMPDAVQADWSAWKKLHVARKPTT